MTTDEMKADRIAIMGDQLGELFFYLEIEANSLAGKWDDFDCLYNIGEERIDLLNSTAPTFFGALQRILWEDLLLSLCRLLDTPRHGNNQRLVLEQLLLRLPDPPQGEVRDLLEAARRLSRFARDWRNARIAHRELPPLRGQPVRPIQTATVQQFEVAWKAACEVLHRVHRHFYPNVDVDYTQIIDAIGGVTALVGVLYVADEAIKEKHIDISTW